MSSDEQLEKYLQAYFEGNRDASEWPEDVAKRGSKIIVDFELEKTRLAQGAIKRNTVYEGGGRSFSSARLLKAEEQGHSLGHFLKSLGMIFYVSGAVVSFLTFLAL